jgi:glycosyltransferase involved in cell wall biosynthesis
MAIRKKIMFMAAHRPNRSPSQRYRFEQYFNYLENNGFTCTLKYIVSAADDVFFYQFGGIFKKLFLLVKFFFIRLLHVVQSLNYQYVFIQRECYFMGPPIFEYLLKLLGRKIIFDFDDAIWLPNVSEGNKKFVWLKFANKTKQIIKLANLVVVGNNYLKEYALQFNTNVVVIPSTIDLNYYQIVPTQNKQKVCIGWSGSPTTIMHFEMIEGVLLKLKTKYANQIEIKVLGDPNYKNDVLGIEGIKWSPETEVAVLNSFDIGIMPLPNNQWTQGKCGMKGLQYMGLGIPSLLSPVGVNKDIIIDGINGFLPTDEMEWESKLELLIHDAMLRKTIGEKGLETIKNNFSTTANELRYLNLFRFFE